MIFFTGDTHFSDPRVLRIDRRPFPDLARHDEALVENWNATVGDDDLVWHLGDFARAGVDVERLLARLNGTKHLIIGNNDGEATIAARGWTSAQHYRETEADGRVLILCHYPFRTWNRMGRGTINLHGHSHGRLAPAPRQYDVGVDPQGMRPVTLEALLASRRGGRRRSGG